jgi:hypothetical protein
MRASSPRIPHIPAELIPLLDASLPRTHTWGAPQGCSPQQLANMRAGLKWATETFGGDSPRRCLLIVRLEHARAEVIL